MDRLYSIAIGGIVAVSVNVLIFPIWAGEQLHQELVTNFKSVADALEGNQQFNSNNFISFTLENNKIVNLVRFRMC